MKPLILNDPPIPGKCGAEGCKHDPKGRSLCGTHRMKKSRLKDPVRYVYMNLKNRAKQRPKEFTLTLEEFREFCKTEDFVPGRDSIDRRKNEHGYHRWNIQKMSLPDNIKKYWTEDRYKPVTDDNPF